MNIKQIADHSDRFLKLDLQFFSEDDMILPDDFQAGPEAEEVTEEAFETPVDAVVDTNEPEQAEEAPEIPTFKVKYNHEEQEISYDDAIPLIQKGMNYDKVQERLQALETDPRLAFVEELAREENMTVDQYLNAVNEYREQERLNQLVQQNIPEELAREILETRKFRDEIKTEKQTKAEEEKRNADFQQFFDYFKQANGRDFVPNKDEIPQEVWSANANGVPLKYAYMEHHNNELKSQLQVFKQNESNATKAPIGGVSTHGSTETAAEDDFMRGFNSI